MKKILDSPGHCGPLVIALLIFAAACGGAAEEPAPEPEAAAVEPAAETIVLDAAALADETRPADEVAQDEYRKPLELYGFFGLEPGMTVADVWPGAGYNMHLLSRFVGDEGSVFGIMGFYADGQYATLEGVQQRVVDAGLNNVTIVNTFADVADDSRDFAVAVRNYHDAANFGDGRPATVEQLYRIVKPGGVVGIVEVATDREGWDEETHRLNEQVVVDEFLAGGFELEARSDMLANPEDDYSAAGFDTGRHMSDRYVLKFRKAAN